MGMAGAPSPALLNKTSNFPAHLTKSANKDLIFIYGDKIAFLFPDPSLVVTIKHRNIALSLTAFAISRAAEAQQTTKPTPQEAQALMANRPDLLAQLRQRIMTSGMTPEQVSRTFERFFRADTSGNIPGTGLGLCLVKEIMELQGGSVELSSEYGVGTRVVLWLSAAEANEALAA